MSLSEMADMDISSSSSTASDTQETQKRKASVAGLKPNGTRPVKRRASKACQCCRARKVRCNVVEHGAPCTNCRLDEVDCIVTESKRRKKFWSNGEGEIGEAPIVLPKPVSKPKIPIAPLDGMASLLSPRLCLHSGKGQNEGHVPHSIYQSHHDRLTLQDKSRRNTISVAPLRPYPVIGPSPALVDSTLPIFSHPAFHPPRFVKLPHYIKPLPPRIGPDEIEYLDKKGALSLPWDGLRNELLRSYLEFVHPFMPVLDIIEFLTTIEAGEGMCNPISLLLFQAVMFTGTAFVDMQHLTNAGYTNRREARKDFFQKARLLYDFDYELDRIALVQALLLMTYWYETPDDQKDTWHWMGVATSLAHTIGLHRNPERSSMELKRRKLWKRMWWSLFMRDRMIALGMRRPTRVKSEDCDVPMLTLDDFDFEAVPDSITSISKNCAIAKDVGKQRQLAAMCVAKAQLCVCISHILSVQYSVLGNRHGSLGEDGNTKPIMLQPKSHGGGTLEVEACDEALREWLANLPAEAQYREPSKEDLTPGAHSLELHRALLHMLYYTTVSALHRPQVLPSVPAAGPVADRESALLDTSKQLVRHAATEITNIAVNLLELDFVRYLPTVGVTVLLPAIIIHLLDIKAPSEETRRKSLQRFCQCMQVMCKLRENYASADYSTAFLEAAIRKADIQVPTRSSEQVLGQSDADAQGMFELDRQMNLIQPGIATALTPPPEADAKNPVMVDTGHGEVLHKVPLPLATSPPHSEDYNVADSMQQALADTTMMMDKDLDLDFEAIINLDATSEDFSFDGDPLSAMQGESSGFTFDMDFMNETNFLDQGDLGETDSITMEA